MKETDTNGLQDARLYLEAIVDSSDDAIVSKTLDGTITSWNRSAEQIFGYSRDEAIGQNISLIIPADRLDEEFVILGKIRAGERVDHFETLRRARDGTLIDISLTVSPIRNESGVVVGASKIARDIRITKSAERLSAHLAAIVSSSDDAIISKNLDGVITSWNASAERMFGYTPQEAIGRHITLIIPPEKLNEEYAILGRVRAGERVDHFETTRRTKSGTDLDISLTVSPIRDGKERIIGASKVARDITLQKRIEAELQESNARKDEFLANMSHELRTPLNAVIGLTHILGKSERLNPREQQCVTMIKQSGDNLLALVNNLLDYARAENGSLQLDAVEFNLPELIEQTIVLQDAVLRAKGLAFEFSYGAGLKDYYTGDPLRLQQILTNLLANAIKFTDKGRIDVSLALKAEADGRSQIVMEVSDTGIGIAAEKLSAIFDKFAQADASTARLYGGSGLGLSICKALAEAMGGDITVTSAPGLGSSFAVAFQLGDSARGERMAHSQKSGEGRKNVLVVEDYDANIVVLSDLLDGLGYSHDIAQNGLEAVRKFARATYDIVLMDIQMPGMDGFETVRRMRNLEQQGDAPRTPIIAVTAHIFDKDRTKYVEANMDGFIAKPIDPVKLTDILMDLIPDPPAVSATGS